MTDHSADDAQAALTLALLAAQGLRADLALLVRRLDTALARWNVPPVPDPSRPLDPEAAAIYDRARACAAAYPRAQGWPFVPPEDDPVVPRRPR